MIKVAVDAMGGDNAPQAPVKGALLALEELRDIDVHISLIGQQGVVEGFFAGSEGSISSRLDIVHASEVITNDDHPTKAIKEKQDSSLVKGMQMLKDGQVDAMISAGNTGALMAGGLMKVGRLKGIKRPALASVFPTFTGKGVVILDIGATMDPKPENLRDYAVMGSIYAEKVLQRDNPRVGLINVGVEKTKGNQLAKHAYDMLDKANINFTGNVEARELLDGVVDVAVCEGFMGNVILKFLEGMGKGIFSSMKEEFTASFKGKLGAYLLRPSLLPLKKRFDYGEYGGAPFLGIDGVLVKSHGSSDARAIKNAITKQVYYLVNEDVLDSFVDRINHHGN